MKIVATDEMIVDAIKSEFMKQEIDLEGWSIDAILEALKSLPTLKSELENYERWVRQHDDNSACSLENAMNGVLRYLATHSKQG